MIGKAKIANNNWFVLLKSLRVLNKAEIAKWVNVYKHFSKKAQSGLFSSGKYFVMILMVETIDTDAAIWLSEGNTLEFLETADTITNGGGYTLVLVKDRKLLFAPKTVKLWNYLRATEFTNSTNQALVDYRNSLD